MNKPRVAILAALIGLALAPAAAASAAHPSQSPRSCGSFTAGGATFQLSIPSGAVGCAEARAVAHRFLAGGGVKHGSGPASQVYWQLGRWRCAHGAGGGSCALPSGPSHKPRARIVFLVPTR